MADTVSTKWIYPPNWDGGYDDNKGTRKMAVQIIGLSDGTGESSVQKIDISNLRTTNGDVCSRTIIEKIEYIVNGLNAHLYWDRTPAETIARLNGSIGTSNGCLDFEKTGGMADTGESGDGTGDIMLTTTGYASGDGYDIIIHFRLK